MARKKGEIPASFISRFTLSVNPSIKNGTYIHRKVVGWHLWALKYPTLFFDPNLT